MTDGWTDRDVADLADDYEIIDELGRGASAVVYRARDRALDRLVAIKVVRPHAVASGSDALERLAREARTVARLSHPNIVTLYAVRRLPSAGGLALVMQLVPGGTLKDLVASEGPLDPERAEAILRDVAGALAYANGRGIVHRDVKPENIFLDSESGRALLADFGIAWSGDQESRLTMTGAAIGTPTYMAPEQIDGAAPDARSDLYSLGLVAWEMLTGERPWGGESLFNVILKQKTEDLPPMDLLRPDVIPDRLQYIVERMLQKHPGARWAGAEAALDKLQRWVVPADYPQWHQARRRRRDEALRRQAEAPVTAPSPSEVATVVFRRDAIGLHTNEATPGGPSADAETPQLLSVAADARALPAVIEERPPTWVLEAVPEPLAPGRSRVVLTVLGMAAVLAAALLAVPAVRAPLLALVDSAGSVRETAPARDVPSEPLRFGGEPQWALEDSTRQRADSVAPTDSVTLSTDSTTADRLGEAAARAASDLPPEPTAGPTSRSLPVAAPRAAPPPTDTRLATRPATASTGARSTGVASGPEATLPDPARLLSPLSAPRVRGRPLVAPTVVAPTGGAPAVQLPARARPGRAAPDDAPPSGGTGPGTDA